MYDSRFRYLVPKEKYTILAGTDWPAYSDWIQNIESNNEEIRNEMRAALSNEILNYHSEYKKKKLKIYGIQSLTKRCTMCGELLYLLSLVPRYFYLDGTVKEFLLIAAICFLLNSIYSVTLHRWLTHKQFTPKIWARPLLLFLVVFVGFGHLKNWIGVHLLHHRYSDSNLDPHPVNNGLLHTMLMVTNINPSMVNDPVFTRKLDKDIEFVIKYFWPLHVVSLLIVAVINFNFFLLSFLLNKSAVIVLNGVINYFGHTGKNNPCPKNINNYFSLFLSGENWHKNHHANVRNFNQSDPGKIDLGYQLLRLFAKNER